MNSTHITLPPSNANLGKEPPNSIDSHCELPFFFWVNWICAITIIIVSSEIYYYYSSYCRCTITISNFLKICHYLPFQCIYKNIWTKIAPTFHPLFLSTTAPDLSHGWERSGNAACPGRGGRSAQTAGAPDLPWSPDPRGSPGPLMGPGPPV